MSGCSALAISVECHWSVQPLDARTTLEAALTLHPGTRHILVVGGTSRLDRG